jgi:flagellar biosynthesis protein FlhA
MAVLPGLPKMPFLLIGLTLGAAAWRMRQKTVTAARIAEEAQPAAPSMQENIESLLKVEPLAVEVGLGLVRLVEGGPSSPLLRRISGIRRQLASDLGYLLPPVRVMDNLSLRAHEYVVSVKGVELARYELRDGFDLAIPIDKAAAQIEGVQTQEPAFGMNALWVPAARSSWRAMPAIPWSTRSTCSARTSPS